MEAYREQPYPSSNSKFQDTDKPISDEELTINGRVKPSRGVSHLLGRLFLLIEHEVNQGCPA
ncbi:MAG: hypothetical protein WA939_10255, partial [Nodosilinea sp.]